MPKLLIRHAGPTPNIAGPGVGAHGGRASMWGRQPSGAGNHLPATTWEATDSGWVPDASFGEPGCWVWVLSCTTITLSGPSSYTAWDWGRGWAKCCTGKELTKLLVPKSHRELHFQAAHYNMMAGPMLYNKTLEQIMAQFCWPRMAHSEIAITEGPVWTWWHRPYRAISLECMWISLSITLSGLCNAISGTCATEQHFCKECSKDAVLDHFLTRRPKKDRNQGTVYVLHFKRTSVYHTDWKVSEATE